MTRLEPVGTVESARPLRETGASDVDGLSAGGGREVMTVLLDIPSCPRRRALGSSWRAPPPTIDGVARCPAAATGRNAEDPRANESCRPHTTVRAARRLRPAVPAPPRPAR